MFRYWRASLLLDKEELCDLFWIPHQLIIWVVDLMLAMRKNMIMLWTLYSCNYLWLKTTQWDML